jgi:single-strand DNA-binding protein
MMSINNVVLIGNLVRDAELKSLNSGTSICKFSVAVNDRKKNGDQWEDDANFFDVIAWGKQGESLHQYLVKGKMVGISGKLKQERWQGQDGQTRSRVEIEASNIQLLGGNGNNGNGGNGNGNHQQNNGNVQNGCYKATW